MEDVQEPAAYSFSQTSPSRQRGRRRLLTGGLALALMLTLGAALVASQVQAAAPPAPVGMIARHMPTMMPTGMPGQCGGQLTVSNVTDRTITVTGANGNTRTVYVTSHTQYVRGGQVVAASAVQVGSHIYVVGTCGQGQNIKATRVEIVG